MKDNGPEDIDYIVVRENTEGLYAGSGGFLRQGTGHEVAVQESVNTYMGVERCLSYAFELAASRKRRKLTLCGKTNVLTYAFGLWDRVFREMSKEYPSVEIDYTHVDATCMWMIKSPGWFDVVDTDNMFGDIITDLRAITQGGLGIAAGGNINPKGVSMFEPIGGSAPKYASQNKANPVAAILAGQLMLADLGQAEAAKGLEEAVSRVLPRMQTQSAGGMGMTTGEVGDAIAAEIT